MEGRTDILFERWFYCDDLGVQVAIKIRCYFFNDLVPSLKCVFEIRIFLLHFFYRYSEVCICFAIFFSLAVVVCSQKLRINVKGTITGDKYL